MRRIIKKIFVQPSIGPSVNLFIGDPLDVWLDSLGRADFVNRVCAWQFTALDATQASWSLIAYCVGLVPLMLIKVLAPAFYGDKTLKPL